jgi:3-phosphoshikimate 1-carboxyvinyltransferase
MVKVRIDKSRISGVLRCPPSKSYTHRAIAIASLAEGESRIKMPLISRDTLATISASTAMGVSIDSQRSGLIIMGKHILNTPSNIINTENSGTTIRIFAVMAALASTGFTILTGVVCYSSRMNGMAPLLIKGGGIQGGSVVINGNMSSQFLSSLLISTIYAKSPVSIHVKGRQVSKPYVHSTLATMKAFGVVIDNKREFWEYRIKNKEYKAAEFNVPADFSTAAMILAAGVLAGGSITIRGLNFLLPQADSKILDILDDMDAQVCVNRARGEIKVTGSSLLEGGSFDLSDSPDLLPVLSILALKARSPVEISGIAHARLKETDRVSNIASQLKKFGATVIEQQDKLLIIAPKVPQNSRIQTFNDHRLFMAFTIASLLTEKSEVEGAESIDVSYPSFLQDLVQLGAKISFL